MAGGLLGVSLATGATAWAWGSAGASALAALVLLVRAWRRQRRASASGRHHVGRRDEPAPPDETATAERSDELAPGEQPAEEDTPATDLLIVCELGDEVAVVDEFPRYHLDGCAALHGAEHERLPVREARELGFTPCAVCGPDAELVARHRATTAG